jgi:hypothetical protein
VARAARPRGRGRPGCPPRGGGWMGDAGGGAPEARPGPAAPAGSRSAREALRAIPIAPTVFLKGGSAAGAWGPPAGRGGRTLRHAALGRGLSGRPARHPRGGKGGDGRGRPPRALRVIAGERPTVHGAHQAPGEDPPGVRNPNGGGLTRPRAPKGRRGRGPTAGGERITTWTGASVVGPPEGPRCNSAPWWGIGQARYWIHDNTLRSRGTFGGGGRTGG